MGMAANLSMPDASQTSNLTTRLQDLVEVRYTNPSWYWACHELLTSVQSEDGELQTRRETWYQPKQHVQWKIRRGQTQRKRKPVDFTRQTTGINYNKTCKQAIFRPGFATQWEPLATVPFFFSFQTPSLSQTEHERVYREQLFREKKINEFNAVWSKLRWWPS